jgi:hypothetical protein
VLILEHHFASKSAAAVHESIMSAYPDNEVPNKTTAHRLVTAFGGTGVFVCDKRSWRDKVAEVTALPTSSNASAATTG